MASTYEDDDTFINSKILDGEILEDSQYRIANQYTTTLTSSKKFVNLTSHPLVVYFRDGSLSILPPQLKISFKEALVIGYKKENNVAPIQVIKGEECEVTNMIRRKLVSSGPNKVYWEESVSIELIQNSRNGVYIKSADVLVTLHERMDRMNYHPFSMQRVHNLYLNLGDNFNPETDVNIAIRFIDNELQHPRLYAIFHERILVITPKRSNTLKTGVYITGLSNLDTETANSARRDVHYSVEAALTGNCPVYMFSSLTEAREKLNELKTKELQEREIDREHEKEVNRMKREKELLEHENNLLKIQQMKEKAALDEIETKRALELQKQKLEYEEKMNRYKEEVAKRANMHKAITEVVKTVAVLATVGLSLYKLANQQ